MSSWFSTVYAKFLFMVFSIRIFARVYDFLIVNCVLRPVFSQNLDGELIWFHIPNRINFFRAKTFFSKEPGTVRWISNFKSGDVFWDVGANVGIYSVCAAKRKATVFAFEPGVNNLEWLGRNISTNNVETLVSLVPLPLAAETALSVMHLSTSVWGGAHNSFSDIVSSNPDISQVKYGMLGVTADDLVYSFGLVQPPKFLKIDVDGLEYEILAGAIRLLRESVEQVLLELDGQEGARDKIRLLLSRHGFNVAETHTFHDTDAVNELWIK